MTTRGVNIFCYACGLFYEAEEHVKDDLFKGGLSTTGQSLDNSKGYCLHFEHFIHDFLGFNSRKSRNAYQDNCDPD